MSLYSPSRSEMHHGSRQIESEMRLDAFLKDSNTDMSQNCQDDGLQTLRERSATLKGVVRRKELLSKMKSVQCEWRNDEERRNVFGGVCLDRLKRPHCVLKPFCAKDLALTFITHADIFNARKV